MKRAVVVPIKNEGEGLEKLALALRAQTAPPDEIIFVDAGSSDGSQDILKLLSSAHPSIRTINAPGAFPGAARNAGIKETGAEIIAQIDGGNLPEPTWLEKLCAPLLSGGADYSMGEIRIMPIMKRFLGVTINVGEVYGASLYGRLRDEKTIGGGACVAYLRSVWEHAGGFPEPYRFGSDSLFARKIAEMKIRTVFVPEAVIYWQIGPPFLSILERQIRYQKAKFRQPESFTRYKGTVVIPLLLIVLALAAFMLPHAWLAVVVAVALYWAKRCLAVWHIYRRRLPESPSPPKSVIAGALIAVVEFMHIFTKIVGTGLGLGEMRQRKAFLREVKSYIHGTPR